MLYLCPLCKAELHTDPPTGRVMVLCNACGHCYVIRGRRVILDAVRYYICNACGSPFARLPGVPGRQPKKDTHTTRPLSPRLHAATPRCPKPGCAAGYDAVDAIHAALDARIAEVERLTFERFAEEKLQEWRAAQPKHSPTPPSSVHITREFFVHHLDQFVRQAWEEANGRLERTPLPYSSLPGEVEIEAPRPPDAPPADADLIRKLLAAGLGPDELERELLRLLGHRTRAGGRPTPVDPD